MPNMLIASPGDPMETRACVRYLNDNPQPSYLRLGKAGESNFHEEIPSIKPGKWIKTDNKKSSKVILSTGTALKIAKELNDNIKMKEFSVSTLPLWGMEFKSQQYKNIIDLDEVIILEDHLIDGGFGSWVLESLIDHKELYKRVNIKGLDSKVCGMVGSQDALNKVGGMDVKDLIN